MIQATVRFRLDKAGKPRASGDDPLAFDGTFILDW